MPLILGSCAGSQRQRDFRFVDCKDEGHCPTDQGERVSPWSAVHEALYWNAVERLAKRDACAGDELIGKIAFQSEKRLTVLCGDAGSALPWLDSHDRIEVGFAIDAVSHVDVFKKMRALKTYRRIGVELTVSYYLKPEKPHAEPIPEGMDYYAVVETDGFVEIQWLTKVAF